ncbi:MAG: tetratricopeptide repeat protein [Pseudomonadota bacterium]
MKMIARIAASAALVAAPGCGNAQSPGLIPSLERLAKAGNAEALYHLGMAYQTGSGVVEDHAKALDAFRRAAALGDPLAAYKLGCYYAGQDTDVVAPDAAAALKYKLVAATAGYALAQQDVGIIYAQKGDVLAGLQWIERSAAQGWSGGLMTLASVYNGTGGVKADPGKTAAYFQLFLARSQANETQTAWLKNFAARLSSEDRRRAEDIVRNFRPAPTPLTLTALSGQRAAQDLVGRSAAH